MSLVFHRYIIIQGNRYYHNGFEHPVWPGKPANYVHPIAQCM